MSALNYKKTSADKSGSLFAIVDSRISENCEEELLARGFEIIKLARDERLGEAVASHTDMLIFRYEDTFIGPRAYFEKNKTIFNKIKNSLPHFNFILTDDEIFCDYPRDAIFNALRLGDKLFSKTDTVSSAVLELAEANNLKVIRVKQGYPACTTLAVGDNFAITSDKGMARALCTSGVEVLEIPESDAIRLPPYKNGFIGGAAGVLEKTVYFIGNLYAHPFGKEIELALSRRGYEAVSLDSSSDALFDLGGMILINTDKNGSNINPKNPNSE